MQFFGRGKKKQLEDEDDVGAENEGGGQDTFEDDPAPHAREEQQDNDFSDPDLDGIEPVEDSSPSLGFGHENEGFGGENPNDGFGGGDANNAFGTDDGFGAGGDAFGQQVDGNQNEHDSYGTGSGSGGSGSESSSGSGSESGSESGSSSGSDEDEGDSDMFGVDKFPDQHEDPSESNNSAFMDEGNAARRVGDPEAGYGESNADLDNWGLDNAEGDLPDAEEHRAATGSSREGGRSQKMIFIVACLFCVGVGAGLAVVFLVRGGDDDSAPRAASASSAVPTSAPTRRNESDIFAETDTPTSTPTVTPTAVPTGVPTFRPTTFEESNFTFAPTIAPTANGTAAPTFENSTTFEPTNSTNTTDVPTVAPVNATTSVPTISPNVTTLAPSVVINGTDAPSTNSTDGGNVTEVDPVV